MKAHSMLRQGQTTRCQRFDARLHRIGFLLATVVCAAWTNISAASQDRGRTLDELVDAKQYGQFEQQLPSANLAKEERLYFEGILADRLNQPLRADNLLQQALPELMKTPGRRAALALKTLAEDEFILGRYSEATRRYSDLIAHCEPYLDAAERRTVHDNRDTFALLEGAAPQTVSGERSFSIRTHCDDLGLLNVPVKIGGKTDWWIWDTGANVSTISRSTALRLGLAISKGHAQTVGGATGTEVSLQTAVIREVVFGGATVHNLAVLVIDDKDLKIDLGPGGTHQINGILGYPVLSAMKTFTVTRSEMQVGTAARSSTRTTRLYVDELTPLVSATLEHNDLTFQFDSGNSGADLTAVFLKKFPARFTSLKTGKAAFGGAGGTQQFRIYRLPTLNLQLGTAIAHFRNITVVDGQRGELLDKLSGNLGQGLLTQFQTVTIDWGKMQLTLGDPVSPTR